MSRRYVAVCGASQATPSQLDAAREVGRLLAQNGAVVINGGYAGVSGAASEGAASEGQGEKVVDAEFEDVTDKNKKTGSG